MKIGDIVTYYCSWQDKQAMEAAAIVNKDGCNVQDELPAIVTAVWSEDSVNLRVICDGNLDLWKTSVPRFNPGDENDTVKGYKFSERE